MCYYTNIYNIYIGTNKLKQAYENPHYNGIVYAEMSRLGGVRNMTFCVIELYIIC